VFRLFCNLCYGGDLKSRRLCIGAGGILNGSIRVMYVVHVMYHVHVICILEKGQKPWTQITKY
jgi:hypothetical protein